MENLLSQLMDKFDARWTIVAERLNGLLLKTHPSNDDAKAIAQAIPRDRVALTYFFDRAEPAWLQPLITHGFFLAPPDPDIDEDAGTISKPARPTAARTPNCPPSDHGSPREPSTPSGRCTS